MTRKQVSNLDHVLFVSDNEAKLMSLQQNFLMDTKHINLPGKRLFKSSSPFLALLYQRIKNSRFKLKFLQSNSKANPAPAPSPSGTILLFLLFAELCLVCGFPVGRGANILRQEK